MQTLLVLLFGWLCVLAQSTFLYPLRISGYGVDLILVCLTYYGVSGGVVKGTWTGFCLGLVVDSFSGSPFGFHTVLYSCTGMAVGIISGFFYWKKWRIQLLVTTLATLIQAGILLLWILALGSKIKLFHPSFSFIGIVWEAILNSLVAPIFFEVFQSSDRITEALWRFIDEFIARVILHRLPPVTKYEKKRKSAIF